MPWTKGDVEKHVKGLSDHQKEVWVNVANSVLERTDDEGLAIRQANAAAKRAPETEKRRGMREADDARESMEQSVERRMGKGMF